MSTDLRYDNHTWSKKCTRLLLCIFRILLHARYRLVSLDMIETDNTFLSTFLAYDPLQFLNDINWWIASLQGWIIYTSSPYRFFQYVKIKQRESCKRPYIWVTTEKWSTDVSFRVQDYLYVLRASLFILSS